MKLEPPMTMDELFAARGLVCDAGGSSVDVIVMLTRKLDATQALYDDLRSKTKWAMESDIAGRVELNRRKAAGLEDQG